jgi:2,5-dihydroxypyridine 5,6-dioxygenase
MDVESYYGNMLIAFGANFMRTLGGENRAPFHFDIPTRNHSIWVDDLQVLDRGNFVIPELQLDYQEGSDQ